MSETQVNKWVENQASPRGCAPPEGARPLEDRRDAPLFGEGLGLDSVDALELVVGLEKEFGIRIQNHEVGREAFASVSALAAFIDGRLAAGEAATSDAHPMTSPHAEWLGAAFDATATVSDWGDGHPPLAAALCAGLDEELGGAAGVGAIVSGASGARRGDRIEARVLRAAWGEAPLPPVLVPKAVTGEYGGGILAPGLLALVGEHFGPRPGFAEPDPAAGVAPHRGGARQIPSRVLLTGLASGGGAAWLVLERTS